jgi:hypothetical protein
LRRLQKTPIVSSFAREGPWSGRESGLPVLAPGPNALILLPARIKEQPAYLKCEDRLAPKDPHRRSKA